MQNSQETQINDNFYCPITYCIMTDPVIGIDGQTYERKAIEDWLLRSNKSPLTNQIMTAQNLVPNIALRKTIESFLIQNPTMHNSVKNKPSELSSAIERKILITPTVFNKNKLYIKLTANEESVRKPTNMIFVIDTSDSMTTITTTTENASSESSESTNLYVLSRLALVKHSIRTVIEVLNENDSICLITFSNYATVVLEITKMTEDGKEKALQVLERIDAVGLTNIWDGLRVALLNVEKITDPTVNISVLLLTDGEPNINPSRGIIPTLQTTIQTRKINQSFTLNTFGYGYALDSKILVDISNCGSGSYAYIPDSSMVGTVFVNYLSNVLATYLSNSKLNITCDDPNVSIVSYDTTSQITQSSQTSYFRGNSTNTITVGNTANMNVGSILFDQPRELLYDIVGLKESTKLKIELIVSKQVISSTFITNNTQANQANPETIGGINSDSVLLPNIIRYNIMNGINKIINNELPRDFDSLALIVRKVYEDNSQLKNGKNIIHSELNKINGFLLDYLNPADKNNGGQIEKAFTKLLWYNKWGKYFLHSIMNAYYNQQCNNFKDPGVQLFAGDLFNQIRVIADDAFCMLPAPKPLIIRYGGFTNTRISRTPVVMSSYYNRDTGCFDGSSIISLFDGSYLPVRSITRGHIIKTIDSNNIESKSTVVCVIKSLVPSGIISMCNINGMLITPWHPILVDNKWVFPINVAQETQVELDCVYNIVLDTNHIIMINFTPVVTLGHGFIDEVVAHPYYGTQQIINDLSRMNGWDIGLITIVQPTVIRRNGIVTKLFDNNISYAEMI